MGRLLEGCSSQELMTEDFLISVGIYQQRVERVVDLLVKGNKLPSLCRLGG